MKNLSVKEYLSLKMPTEEAPVSDQSRILLALGTHFAVIAVVAVGEMGITGEHGEIEGLALVRQGCQLSPGHMEQLGILEAHHSR